MLLSALLQWFAGNFFIVAAGWWLGMAALGALRLAQYIFGLLNVLLQAVENYAVPAASKLQHEQKALAGFLKNILKKSMLVILPALLTIVVFSKQLLLLSGGEAYGNYSYVMYGLSVNYLLIVAGIPVRIALRVKLLNQHYFIGYALATAFSMLTARWLIGQWELKGVLFGLFFTQLLVVAYWLIILDRKKVITWKLFTSY
jgi:O-antigen/teichoic acid export membrane protein